MNWLRLRQRRLELERSIWLSLRGRLRGSRDWFRGFRIPTALRAAPPNRGGMTRAFPLCKDGLGEVKNELPTLKAQPLSFRLINPLKIPTMLGNSTKLNLGDRPKKVGEKRKRKRLRQVWIRAYFCLAHAFSIPKEKKGWLHFGVTFFEKGLLIYFLFI